MTHMNNSKMSQKYNIPAVVVGLCTHGLSICRSLGRKGIPVYAIESNRKLPGLSTRYAEKVIVNNINNSELIRDLIRIRKRFRKNPVLYLTNDNMVKNVASSYDQIAKLYRINWPPVDLIQKLLKKQNLEDIVKQKKLNYPKTTTISHYKDINKSCVDLNFPIILKPAKPLSPFKAIKIYDENELKRQVKQYQDTVDLFLIQEWISGPERNLFFASLYFDNNCEPIAHFTGQKIRNCPPGTGVTTCAEPCNRKDVLNVAYEFFKGLPIKGPVSLEVKEDKNGSLYIIEPTIGRFDFWILCCIKNGVDFPYISYKYQTDNCLPTYKKQNGHTIWIDFELDFVVLLEKLKEKDGRKDVFRSLFKRKIFALWAWDDFRPSLYAWPKGFKKYFKKIITKLRSL